MYPMQWPINFVINDLSSTLFLQPSLPTLWWRGHWRTSQCVCTTTRDWCWPGTCQVTAASTCVTMLLCMSKLCVSGLYVQFQSWVYFGWSWVFTNHASNENKVRLIQSLKSLFTSSWCVFDNVGSFQAVGGWGWLLLGHCLQGLLFSCLWFIKSPFVWLLLLFIYCRPDLLLLDG